MPKNWFNIALVQHNWLDEHCTDDPSNIEVIANIRSHIARNNMMIVGSNRWGVCPILMNPNKIAKHDIDDISPSANRMYSRLRDS
jgi:hypothetical protein